MVKIVAYAMGTVCQRGSLIASGCWLILLLTGSAIAAVMPVDLQCESKLNPLGLTETSPRLSWQIVATVPGERGQYLTGYRIEVASSLQNLTNNLGDLWDTGQVITNQASQISYAGSPLATDQVCYWHVQVWDKYGQPSDWSPPASWSMGLLLTNAPVVTAQITWGAQGIFTNNSVLSLAGATSNEVYGVDFGGSGARTVNGYTFADYATSGKVAIAGSGYALYGSYLTGGATTGDTALNSILTHGLYGSTANTATLKNLTVGQSYTVMALLADTRGAAAGGSVFRITDGMSFSPNQTYAFANGSPAVGGYFIGTFTATATTQSYTVENGNGSAFNSQYNAILLLTNTSPATNYVLQSRWTGQWIGRDNAPAYANTNDGKSYLAATHLRKDFTLSQMPVRAVLYVTSLGLVEPHLNGAKVGNDYFVPGWTDYSKRVYYRAYDVTSLLQSGTNTLGAILGDGWFRGNISILGQNYYGSKTRLDAELHLFYANGTNQVIVSDSSWSAGFGPIRQSDIQSGEYYNAQLEVPGWDRPGYTNATWTAVTTGASVTPLITAAPAEPVCTNQTITPIAITQPQPGVYVVNFGQNFAGWARLTLSNQQAGGAVVMRFAEWLNPDGTVNRANLRSAAATDTYICKGGVETWEPHFTYHGFQYVQVQGLAQAPTTKTFTGVVVHSGLAETGAFQCSNDLINHIYSNMLWSVRANSFDIPTDCPQRDERMGWCDGTEVMRSAMFMAQGESFYGKWYQDMVDGKLDATTFPQMAPSPHKNFGFASGWSDCGVLLPYWVYQTYGDTRLASRFYADMQSHMQHYAATAITYIGQSGSYSDWLATDTSTPGNLMSTAFYAGCASEMAELALVLGKPADAAAYGLLFTNICSAFQANFVSSDGTVGSGSESGYVLALHFNLLTPAQRQLAAAKLVNAVQAQNGHISTGMVTTHWLLSTLTASGRSDLAYQMLAKTDYPSWGYWIKLGATSMWEQWNSVNADGTINTACYNYPMDSLNHANLGTCAEWFYQGILGIDLLSPGFAKILINPQPGGALTSAQGYYDSIAGRIGSAWQLTNNLLTLNVTIPANATAEIHVPTTNAAAITESGLPAAGAPGVTYVGVSNNAAIYTVGSGTYSFTSPFLVSATLPVSVFNFSFEANVASGPGTETTTVPTGWSEFNQGGSGDIGSQWAGGVDYTVSTPLASPADGNQYCFINMFNAGVTGGIYQDVGALQPNTTYTLTVAIGSRSDRLNSPGTILLVNGGNDGGAVLASGGGLPTAQNSWQDYTVSFTSGAVVSGDLTIVLSVPGNGTTIQADFDNVRLVATPVSLKVPELGVLKVTGTNLILSGTNGTPNSGYTWLAATNLSAPIHWKTNSTGTLDGAGAFSNGIPINASQPVGFFQLRVP